MNGPAPLAARIAELIAVQGPISVAQYMALALHDAQSGYYATRDPLGADFITAPEISQMFGEILGLWCAQVWQDQGCPKNIRLVELGPGRGTLMADMLRALKLVPEMNAEVVMIEASPVLKAIQRQTLQASGIPIIWKTHFDESLADRPLLLVANEFFDALPIRQYAKTERGWCERMVVERDGALSFALAPSALPHSAIPADRNAAPDGGIYETSPAATALAEEIARIVTAKGGGALILDYGYCDRDGFSETLQAVKANQFAGVLADPGSHDLSAHVDFAALADAGRRGGAIVHGPRDQGEFLVRLGLARRAEQLMKANPAMGKTIYAALERLIHPAQMGTLFKALAFLPPSAGPTPGF
jgi:NADH dehydrogenase [ubiquinone] 1 alpha subcomplex assembly factor 7